MITGYLLIVLSSTAGFAAAVLTYKRPLSGSAQGSAWAVLALAVLGSMLAVSFAHGSVPHPGLVGVGWVIFSTPAYIGGHLWFTRPSAIAAGREP